MKQTDDEYLKKHVGEIPSSLFDKESSINIESSIDQSAIVCQQSMDSEDYRPVQELNEAWEQFKITVNETEEKKQEIEFEPDIATEVSNIDDA